MQKPGGGGLFQPPTSNLQLLYTLLLVYPEGCCEGFTLSAYCEGYCNSIYGVPMKPNVNLAAAFAATLLLSLAPFATSAQEHTQERDTKTVEKEKPAEPTPPPPKEESSVTEHSIKIAGQTIPYKAIAGTILLKNEKRPEPTPPPPKEESSATEHSIKTAGKTIPYKAIAGTILLKNEKDEPQALIYSTSYIRTDNKDVSQRPISFIYNGGPGSASVWLHMGAFGPRRVLTANAEATPPPPYRLSGNAGTLLDKTDMVFLDPVGTGFSHAVGKAQDKDFGGVDQDVKSLAQFITLYVSRNGRWNSPKFLIGESYGTFRSAALGNYLQAHDGMDFNGIVLISSILDLGTISFYPGSDMPYIFY